jgi:hypothetical protein
MRRRASSADPTPALSSGKRRGLQRREFHEALLEAASFEDLPRERHAAVLKAEQNRRKLRLISND